MTTSADQASSPSQIAQATLDTTNQAIKVNIVAGAVAGSTTYTRNTVSIPPTIDTVTAANNRPFPVVTLAGDSLGPISVGTGAAAATTLRVILSTDSGVNQLGTWTTGRTWTTASGTDSVAAVQSGTWNIGTVTTVSAVTTLTSITNTVKTAEQGASCKYYAYFTHTSTTAAAYSSVTLTTVSAGACTSVYLSDTSGTPSLIGVDPAGGTAYAAAFVLPANGSAQVNLTMTSGATIGVKSLGSTITSGSLAVTCMG